MGWDDQDKAERRGWFARLHLTWPTLFLAGWLLYEFTAMPGLAALVACAKFGWADVRIAFWLRRVDPDVRRGRAWFWGYLTYGLWKVAIVAALSLAVIGTLESLFIAPRRWQAGNPGVSPVFSGALKAVVVAFSIALPLCYVALRAAWRNGARIWRHRSLRWALENGNWPPMGQGVKMQLFALTALLLITFGGLTVIWVWFVDEIIEANNPLPCLLALLTIHLVGSVGLLRAGSRLSAVYLHECWSVEAGEVYKGEPLKEV